MLSSLLHPDTKALVRATALGIIIGVLAAITVLAFRLSIEIGQSYFLPDGHSGNFEALDNLSRFLFPVIGALLLAAFFDMIPEHMRSVGIGHVIDYIRFRKQNLPLANAAVQFVSAVIAVVSGHSVDREGPGVHIGAANAGLLSKHLRLSEDDHYLLTAAGGAAAIAAAYNTPLAGVIFVIEVFRVRYALNHIVPIIVATVTGTVTGGFIIENYDILSRSDVHFGGHPELPFIAMMGVAIGITANIFIRSVVRLRILSKGWSPFISFTLAGVITGTLAMFAPEIMGISYDTLNRLLYDKPVLTPLWLLFIAKLTATISAIGFGIPGGLIGPSLFIGGSFGALAEHYAPGMSNLYSSSAGFYTLIGMVAMMGAVLRAPLAALVALMELSSNIELILPGMVVVVVAELVTRAGIGDRSAITALLAISHATNKTVEKKAEDPAAQTHTKP